LHLKPLPPASQGGSATRHDERLPSRLLRLRCAPPSAMSNVAHAKAGWRHPHHSERVAKQTSCTPKRASCEAGCERPKKRARAGAVPTTASELRSRSRALQEASESGHLKRSFSSPPVARATKKGHCAIGCAVAPWGKRSWLTVWGECLEQCGEYRYLSTVVEMVAREVHKKREVFALHTSRVACINHACSAANPTCGNVKTCIEI
jgi:hypothetical protein